MHVLVKHKFPKIMIIVFLFKISLLIKDLIYLIILGTNNIYNKEVIYTQLILVKNLNCFKEIFKVNKNLNLIFQVLEKVKTIKDLPGMYFTIVIHKKIVGKK